MAVMDDLKVKASESLQRIVFPEATDARVLEAAAILVRDHLATPVLLGHRTRIATAAADAGLDLRGVVVTEGPQPDQVEAAVTDLLLESALLSRRKIMRMVQTPLNLAALMVRMGEADGMVAGLHHATSDVILSSQLIIGLDKEVTAPSSMFLMDIPGYAGSEGPLLIFADGGVAIDPDADELADIAISTARTASALLGWEPRVAFISFSTDGSAEHEKVELVRRAVALAQAKAPGLLVDGEFQVDAAINPTIAAKKVNRSSTVAGRANILVFPDLDAANPAYKLVQQLAHANAYGPFLQGFARAVTDLSRGSSVEDVVGVSVMTAVRAQRLN